MKNLEECIQEAIDNNLVWEFMGWDLKHGPNVEELEALEILRKNFS